MTLVISVFMHDFLERVRRSDPTARNSEFHQKSGNHGGLVDAGCWTGGSILIAGQRSEATVKSNLTSTLHHRHQPLLAVGPALGFARD